MKLSEIKEGGSISIECANDVSKINFKSVVKKVFPDCIYIDPITKNNKPISLKSDKVLNNLYYYEEGKNPVIWKDCDVSFIKDNKEYYHKISCNTEGKTENRRQSYRLYVGIHGTVNVGISKNITPIIVRDISETGFSFVSNEKLETDGMYSIHIRFEFDETKFMMTGKLMWEDEVNQRYLYGCKVSAANKEIGKFITKKQREKIKQQRR